MKLAHENINEKSNPIGVLLFLSEFLNEQGYDSKIFFEQFHIDIKDFNDKLKPISLATQAKIFHNVGLLTHCDHLGLIIGRKACLSNIGPLKFLVLNSATVRDALDTLFQYGHIWYKGQKFKLNENDQDYASISTTVDCNTIGVEQYQTAQLVALVSIIELILGKLWRPTLVRISYPKPKSAHLYEKFFKCPVWFGQAHHEIIFPRSQLDEHRSGYDNELNKFFHDYLSSMKNNHDDNLINRVSKLIEELLPSGECTSDKIADYFSMHRFTLYRYLCEQGTTFARLLEDVKKKVAFKLLKNKELLLIEVSNRIGYEDQANFTRAFKRWSGVTPARWRKENI